MRRWAADQDEEFRSLRIDVSNAARPWTILAPAVACRARIEFYNAADGHNVFGRPMVGRWANSPAPEPTISQMPGGAIVAILDVDKFNRESRLDIYPAETEPLDVAVRFKGDQKCYGWNNKSTLHPKGRVPQWELSSGVFIAKVTVTVSGKPHVRYFRIHNEGPHEAFRLELASANEVKRIRNASR